MKVKQEASNGSKAAVSQMLATYGRHKCRKRGSETRENSNGKEGLQTPLVKALIPLAKRAHAVFLRALIPSFLSLSS